MVNSDHASITNSPWQGWEVTTDCTGFKALLVWLGFLRARVQVQRVDLGGEAKGEEEQDKGRKLTETHSPSASTFLA